jgi:hypothetical protein
MNIAKIYLSILFCLTGFFCYAQSDVEKAKQYLKNQGYTILLSELNYSKETEAVGHQLTTSHKYEEEYIVYGFSSDKEVSGLAIEMTDYEHTKLYLSDDDIAPQLSYISKGKVNIMFVLGIRTAVNKNKEYPVYLLLFSALGHPFFIFWQPIGRPYRRVGVVRFPYSKFSCGLSAI